MNDKQLALSTLEALPESASLHDIREELEILESVKKGQQAARDGHAKPQEEVEHLDLPHGTQSNLDRPSDSGLTIDS